jgi:LDH2 family malate/lactate/ureidoglycolate dehydrogenase
MPVVSAHSLKLYTEKILIAAGVPQAAAELISDSLVSANLRGVDSHGVQLLPLYIQQIEQGNLDPQARGHVVSSDGACLLFNAECAFGQVAAAQACDHAVRLADEFGLGFVTVRNSNHFGAAAYWGTRMEAAGKIGIVFCNASPLVAPWQAKQPVMGTNPICVAVPGPWLLDMATSAVAYNKIYDAAMRNAPSIPEGWALNASGGSASKPAEALKGSVMPLGGQVAGFKGSGLAAAVEILCSVLSGGPIGREVGSMRSGGRMNVSQTFLAIDIKRFMPVEEFRQRVEHFVAMMKSTPPAEGYDEVLVAGDPQWRAERQRSIEGISIPEATWRLIARTADKLGISLAA